MNLYSQFQTDENLEKEGIWIQYGETDKGEPIRIKIARAGGQNIKFTKALDHATKPYRKAIQTNSLDAKTADSLYRNAFIDTVVLDWVNVEDRDGKKMDFNKENCLKLFKDLPDLFNDLREQAANASLFREHVREEDLGNSGKSSNTASSKEK